MKIGVRMVINIFFIMHFVIKVAFYLWDIFWVY